MQPTIEFENMDFNKQKDSECMKVGLVVAIEVDAVLAKYGAPKEKEVLPGFSVMQFDCDGYTLYVADSGAGEISAASATQFLITKYGVDVILNFGVVGALTERMQTADLCVVDSVVHYDFDSTDWLNLPRGQYPGYDSEFVQTDRTLLEKAMQIKPDLVPVVCASADKFVSLPSAKAELHSTFGADICEMESAGILYTCKRNGVPCLLIKAVSDSLIGGGKEFLTEVGRVSEICFDVTDKILRELN